MSDGGKGSRPRPFSVDYKTFSNNWDAIFKKPVLTECSECGQPLPNPCKCDDQETTTDKDNT